jgi:competence protein ComEC
LLTCDSLGCFYRRADHVVALAWSTEALLEDCHEADLVISLEPVREPCPSARRVIDRFDLWRQGGHAIWLRPGLIEVATVSERRGNRPWVARPPARAEESAETDD